MDAPNASVPSDGETVGAKYNFIAKYIPGQTEIVPLGKGSGSEWNHIPGIDREWNAVLKDKNAKGNVGILYKNVGSVSGQIVDVKIVVTDFVGDNSGISFRNDKIGLDTLGSVGISWKYLKHNTDVPIEVNGYMTFNDIDAGQGLLFAEDFSKKIDHVYVPTAESRLGYGSFTNGRASYFDNNGILSEETDPRNQFTAVYSDTSSMNFGWIAGDYFNQIDKVEHMSFTDNLKVSDVQKIFGSNHQNGGSYFGYTSKKPLRTETIPPVKFVSDDDQKFVNENTLKAQSDPFNYNIQAQVPEEWAQFYYKSYVITDDLIPELKLNSIKVTDETGKNSTGMFTNSTKGNHIELSATDVSLKSANFYNHTYTVHTDVQLRSGQNFHNYVDEKTGVTTFKNTATLIIDGKKASSNTVQTHVNKIGSSIDKWIVE